MRIFVGMQETDKTALHCRIFERMIQCQIKTAVLALADMVK